MKIHQQQQKYRTRKRFEVFRLMCNNDKMLFRHEEVKLGYHSLSLDENGRDTRETCFFGDQRGKE